MFDRVLNTLLYINSLDKNLSEIKDKKMYILPLKLWMTVTSFEGQ